MARASEAVLKIKKFLRWIELAKYVLRLNQALGLVQKFFRNIHLRL